ncbi:hypothetical protein J3R83DRAFT_10731 [Lanmaoa asiatica]|nr:hypothetical protein J3R83DRAFT_10731 [Lanmaoa asiatica]
MGCSLQKPELSHYQLRNYVRSYASYLNINSNDENPQLLTTPVWSVSRSESTKPARSKVGDSGLNLLSQPGRDTYRATLVDRKYSTLALAKVWSNMAKLPSSQTMRELFEKSVEERGGYGKHVLFLGRKYLVTIRYMIGWLNEAAAKYGGKQVRCLHLVDAPTLTILTLTKVDGLPK